MLEEDFEVRHEHGLGTAPLDPHRWNSGWFTSGLATDSTAVNPTDEAEWYSPRAIDIRHGHAVLKLTRRANPTFGQPLRSAMITTAGRFAIDATRRRWIVEARVRIPGPTHRGGSYWPAMWLLSTDNGPGCDPCVYPPELDAFEYIGDGVGVSHLHTVGPADANVGLEFASGEPDMSHGFHTYTVDLSPTRLELFVDGTRRWVERDPDLIGRTVGQGPMYLLLNLAYLRDGAAPDPVPASMEIDHVYAWRGARTDSPSRVPQGF